MPQKRHFAKACLSSRKQNENNQSSISATIHSCIAAIPMAKESLSRAITNVTIQGVVLQALIDSGSTDSFISTSTVKSLNIKVNRSSGTVAMASTSLLSTIHSECKVDLIVNGNVYSKVKLAVLENLCCDVLLGQDFMKLHDCVSFKLGGSRPKLVLCNLAAMTIQPPRPFEHLQPFKKPIAVPSRRFSKQDDKFISQEIERLIKEEIIEKSTSPWRAQVHVVGQKKRRLVIDYSQIYNLECSSSTSNRQTGGRSVSVCNLQHPGPQERLPPNCSSPGRQVVYGI